MRAKSFRFGAVLILASLAVLLAMPMFAYAGDLCAQYRNFYVRAAQARFGPDAPVPMFMAQARQESSCRADVTAVDLGRGLLQFMDGTAEQVSRQFPQLGPPQPYDPRWAIQAQMEYDGWLYSKVRGRDDCNRWAAALKAYNAGLGYVQQAQAKSPQPAQWFGITEFVPTRQSAKNFESGDHLALTT